MSMRELSAVAEQQQLRSAVRGFLKTAWPMTRVRASFGEPAAWDRGVWRQLAELGCAGVAVPEVHGGGAASDQPAADLAVLAAELGRALQPWPLIGVSVAAMTVSAAGTRAQRDAYLPKLLSGEVLAGWCRSDCGAVTATAQGAGVVVDGSIDDAPDVAGTDLLLITAEGASGPLHALVGSSAAGVTIEPIESLDLTRRIARVSFDGVVVDADRVIVQPDVADGEDPLDICQLRLATLITTADALGGLERVVELAVEYAKIRVAFDRTIGSFQAMKHKLANLQLLVEGARATTAYAADALDNGTHDADYALAAAKVFVTEAYERVGHEGIQVHGGTGFTWEHDSHLFLRRSIADQVLYGNPSQLRERLLQFAERDLDHQSDQNTNDDTEIPQHLVDFRRLVAEYFASHAPRLSGNRGPRTPAEVDALRQFLRGLVAAGFPVPGLLDIGRGPNTDKERERIVGRELAGRQLSHIVGNALGIVAIAHFGSDEQRARYLPGFLCFDHVWTQLFSEPDAGSDLAAMRTTAVLQGDHYLVNGSKIWSSFAHLADYGLLPARTDPTVVKQAGISMFVVDMHAPGVTISPLAQMNGEEEFNQVFLDNVRIPVSDRIGDEGEGWTIARNVLESERLAVGGVSAESHGARVPPLIELARTQRLGGHPAIVDAATRQEIAALHVRGHMVHCINQLLTARARGGNLGPADASVAKILNSEFALDAYGFGLRLFGTGALDAGGELTDRTKPRWWQDMWMWQRALIIGGGPNEIQRNLIAERGLGLPKEPKVAVADGAMS